MTHSTWQEKRKRVFGDETRRESSRREGGSAVVDERSSDRPREGGNAAGTYLGGTRARYPDTCRAHEAMDATTSRGLDESGRGGCVLCLRQKAQILPSERKPACSTFQLVWYGESLSYEPCRTAYSSCQNERLGCGEYFRDRESARAWHDLDSGYFFHRVCLRSPELFVELFVGCRKGVRDRPSAPIERALTSRRATTPEGRARASPRLPLDSEAVA